MRNIVLFSILVLTVFSVMFAPSLVDAKKLVNISDKSGSYRVIPNHDLCDNIKEDYFITVIWITDVKGDNFQVIYDLDKKNKIVQIPKGGLQNADAGITVKMKERLPAGEYIFDLLYNNHLVEDSQVRVTIPEPNCSEQTKNGLEKNSEATNQQSGSYSNKIKILNKNGSYEKSDVGFICPSTCTECHDLYDVFVHWVLDKSSVSVLDLSTVITTPSQSQLIQSPGMSNDVLRSSLSDVPDGQYIFELFYDGFAVPDSKIYVTIPNPNCPEQTKTALKKDSGTSIPDWIKKSAMWWSEGTTTDREFANALGFLVKEKLIQVPLPTNANGTITISKNLVIPDWIKKNAGWWSENKISDNDFKEGIKHMINEDIISFNAPIPNDPAIAPNPQNATQTRTQDLSNLGFGNYTRKYNNNNASLGLEINKCLVNSPFCTEEEIEIGRYRDRLYDGKYRLNEPVDLQMEANATKQQSPYDNSTSETTNQQNATQIPYKYYVKPGDVSKYRDIPPPPKSSDAQEKSQNATSSQNATKYTIDKSKVSSSNTQIKTVPKSTTPVTPKPVTPLK